MKCGPCGRSGYEGLQPYGQIGSDAVDPSFGRVVTGADGVLSAIASEY
jgi:hypothetical protein